MGLIGSLDTTFFLFDKNLNDENCLYTSCVSLHLILFNTSVYLGNSQWID